MPMTSCWKKSAAGRTGRSPIPAQAAQELDQLAHALILDRLVDRYGMGALRGLDGDHVRAVVGSAWCRRIRLGGQVEEIRRVDASAQLHLRLARQLFHGDGHRSLQAGKVSQTAFREQSNTHRDISWRRRR